MNVLINYDLICAVKNVNEKFSIKKITRNNKGDWAKINLPVFLGLDCLIYKGDIKKIITMLIAQFGIVYTINLLPHLALKTDLYKEKSEQELKKLVSKLKDSNIETSYELIKQSKQYDRKYEIRLNEQKIPQILQSKYILLPTYDYAGRIKDTSVLQEHVMGSKDYVLSLGSPKKVLKPAFSNI